MTDEARHYMEVGREFKSHGAVNHRKDQYVRYWNEVLTRHTPTGKPVVETTNHYHQHRGRLLFGFSSAV
jgi:hypothetical protein